MNELLRQKPGVRVIGNLRRGYQAALSPQALEFLGELFTAFAPRVDELLAKRRAVQALLDRGEKLDFLPETLEVRASTWSVAPLPKDLLDRRVEITGPVDRKMIINALNSGANVFMADFEDSNAPTWDNVIEGQLNLMDAVRGTLKHTAPKTGKQYRLNEKVATLLVRPRGFHLFERHVEFRERPVPASLFDFGLYFFHNAKELLARGSGPYFYLPKMEHHLEAALWNDVFLKAQALLDIPRGTIKATVLIETIPAAFQMDEILYALREHSAGLNCGRWDYMFSFIKKFRVDPHYVFPDRVQVTMTQPFLRAYTQLLVKTCHRRGVHAMGGMAAQIPIKDDEAANRAALDKVRVDKRREAKDGHDGTWVAHPALVPLAKEIFDEQLSGPNQLDVKREDVQVEAADLLQVPTGTRTEAGLRQNVRVGVQYLEAWLRGSGCVPLYHLMEDAATAEISRTQLWQWIHHAASLEDGRVVTAALFTTVLDEELAHVRGAVGNEKYFAGKYEEARAIFERLCTSPQYEEFLTIPAYEVLTAR